MDLHDLCFVDGHWNIKFMETNIQVEVHWFILKE